MKKKQQKSNLIKETFLAVKAKPLFLAIPVFIDFFAMLLFGYTLIDMKMRALNVVANLNTLLQKSVNATVEVLNSSNMVETFNQSTELVTLEGNLIKIVLLLLVAFWFIWLVFQGSSWRYASIIAGKKPKYFRFMGKFISVNLIWLSLLSLINLFILSHQFGLQIELHKTTLDWITVIALIFTIIIGYFMFISYALLSRNTFKQIFKKTFIIGIKKIDKVIFSYLIILIGFFLIDLLLRLFGLFEPIVAFIAGIFILLPYITIARVYLIKRIEEFSMK